MYERCCLGVPSIIITIAENQIINTMQLKELGVIHYLGESKKWNGQEMMDAINLVENKLEQMSIDCLKILPDNSYTQICQKLFEDL
jgi:UDP-2,4-diacetamido-2,4,6-trideoxy-beta-L-altropyranose hydrolase